MFLPLDYLVIFYNTRLHFLQLPNKWAIVNLIDISGKKPGGECNPQITPRWPLWLLDRLQ